MNHGEYDDEEIKIYEYVWILATEELPDLGYQRAPYSFFFKMPLCANITHRSTVLSFWILMCIQQSTAYIYPKKFREEFRKFFMISLVIVWMSVCYVFILNGFHKKVVGIARSSSSLKKNFFKTCCYHYGEELHHRSVCLDCGSFAHLQRWWQNILKMLKKQRRTT